MCWQQRAYKEQLWIPKETQEAMAQGSKMTQCKRAKQFQEE